jgi:hypothetical protein
MDSTNQQNNPNDIEENSSRSTEVGTTDETIISANQVHSEEDQPKKLKIQVLKLLTKNVFCRYALSRCCNYWFGSSCGLGFLCLTQWGKVTN